MGIVNDLRKKIQVGQEEGIVSAGQSAKDLEAFKTISAEARELANQGQIEILIDEPTRVRFKRLQ